MNDDNDGSIKGEGNQAYSSGQQPLPSSFSLPPYKISLKLCQEELIKVRGCVHIYLSQRSQHMWYWHSDILTQYYSNKLLAQVVHMRIISRIEPQLIVGCIIAKEIAKKEEIMSTARMNNCYCALWYAGDYLLVSHYSSHGKISRTDERWRRMTKCCLCRVAMLASSEDNDVSSKQGRVVFELFLWLFFLFYFFQAGTGWLSGKTTIVRQYVRYCFFSVLWNELSEWLQYWFKIVLYVLVGRKTAAVEGLFMNVSILVCGLANLEGTFLLFSVFSSSPFNCFWRDIPCRCWNLQYMEKTQWSLLKSNLYFMIIHFFIRVFSISLDTILMLHRKWESLSLHVIICYLRRRFM